MYVCIDIALVCLVEAAVKPQTVPFRRRTVGTFVWNRRSYYLASK